MITFSVVKSNPKENFNDIFSFTGKVAKNKYWEFESYYYDWYWVEVEFDWKWSGYDHAGPKLSIGLFGFYIQFRFYDSRHWDEQTHNWVI